MEKGQASNIVKEWQWQTDSDSESLGYMACHSLAAGPKILCRWWGDKSETPSEAALLEAAPDLLNALSMAQATIERLERHAPGSANGTLDVVRAAIAKAGGAQ